MTEGWTRENKSKKTIKLAAYLTLLFCLGFGLWVYYYPIAIYSPIFWLGVILMGIPIYIAAESIGSLGLNAKFVKELSRFSRILFGLVWILSGLVIFSLVVGLLSTMVS